MCSVLLISRKDAKAQGLLRYFTGDPCLHGHIAERATISNRCLSCAAEKARAKRLKNPELNRIAVKKYSLKNVDKEASRKRNFQLKNREKINNYARVSYANKPELIRQKNSIWAKNNRSVKNTITADRWAAKIQRTPAWLNSEDHWFIKEIYDLATLRSTMTSVKWHVDHIVPLQGENVSGLHVPWNLQVIPATENMSKGNRFNG